MKKNISNAMKKNINGSSLLEELIALVIISIGLLGMTSLQLTAMKDNQVALDHTQASNLACEILDLMRANPDLSMDDRYNMSFNTSSSTSTGVSYVDVNNWKSRIAQMLPDGDASITRNGKVFTITIQWNETHSGGVSNKQFVISSEL